MSQKESKWEHDLNNLERKTERGMWWVRIDRVRDIISEAISAREKEIAEEVEKKRMSLVEEIEFDVVARNSNNMTGAYNSGLDEALQIINRK